MKTVWNGASLKGYCYNDNGYPTRTDSAASSRIWIYVDAGGVWGYASTWWFNQDSTFGLPLCPGSPPTG